MSHPNRSVLLKRQRGAVAFLARPRFDGPVARELRGGLTRIGAEIRRTAALVNIRRKLRSIDREERRAIREVDYLRNELLQHERNLEWLLIEYTSARKQLSKEYEMHLERGTR